MMEVPRRLMALVMTVMRVGEPTCGCVASPVMHWRMVLSNTATASSTLGLNTQKPQSRLQRTARRAGVGTQQAAGHAGTLGGGGG